MLRGDNRLAGLGRGGEAGIILLAFIVVSGRGACAPHKNKMGFNLIKGGGRSSSPFSFFSTKGIRDNNLKSKVENLGLRPLKLEDVNPDFLY